MYLRSEKCSFQVRDLAAQHPPPRDYGRDARGEVLRRRLAAACGALSRILSPPLRLSTNFLAVTGLLENACRDLQS